MSARHMPHHVPSFPIPDLQSSEQPRRNGDAVSRSRQDPSILRHHRALNNTMQGSIICGHKPCSKHSFHANLFNKLSCSMSMMYLDCTRRKHLFNSIALAAIRSSNLSGGKPFALISFLPNFFAAAIMPHSVTLLHFPGATQPDDTHHRHFLVQVYSAYSLAYQDPTHVQTPTHGLVK